jgi:branched-chain amino acid transport system substrate-binding protein
MNRKNGITLLIIPTLLVLAIILTACGAPAPGTQIIPQTGATQSSAGALPASIKIGAVIPLTGRYAAGGAQVKNGYELAIADINAKGGVDVGGKKLPLELNVLDDESDATKTVQNLETLNSDNVVAYLGGFGSDLHAAAAGIAEKNKVPYIGVAFALYKVHQQGFKYLFSPFPKSPALAKSTFDMLDSLSPKPTKIAVFAEKTDWGAELSKLWTDEANKRGGYTITTYEYAPGATDFSSIILPAKDAGTEVVLGLPNPPDGLALAKQMKELDLNAKLYIFIRAADPPTWGKNLAKDGDGFMLMPGWNNGEKFQGVADMAARYQAKYGTPAAATTGPAYAAVQILADAIHRAGSLDRDKIRDAIAATDMDTIMGHVTFNPDGTGNVLNVIDQWQDGKQVLVWPPDQAVGKIQYPATPWKER